MNERNLQRSLQKHFFFIGANLNNLSTKLFTDFINHFHQAPVVDQNKSVVKKIDKKSINFGRSKSLMLIQPLYVWNKSLSIIHIYKQHKVRHAPKQKRQMVSPRLWSGRHFLQLCIEQQRAMPFPTTWFCNLCCRGSGVLGPIFCKKVSCKIWSISLYTYIYIYTSAISAQVVSCFDLRLSWPRTALCWLV